MKVSVLLFVSENVLVNQKLNTTNLNGKCFPEFIFIDSILSNGRFKKIQKSKTEGNECGLRNIFYGLTLFRVA